MIKSRLLLFLLAASMLVFNSCEKIPGHATGVSGSGSGTGTTSGSGTMTFTLDGVAKSASSTLGVYSSSLGMLQVNGQLGAIGSQEVLGITIQNPSVGTFPITANNTLCIYNTPAGDSWIGATGTVIITTYSSDTVIGTFNFVASNFSGGNTTKNITSGAFNVKYIKQ